jgi:hypothetical protein
MKVDTCFLQSYETHAWVHYATKASIWVNGKDIPVRAFALGPSVKTNSKGIEAELIEVNNIDEIKKLDRKNIEGKIVFINQVMSNQYIIPSTAYGSVIQMRIHGASESAKYGAVATIIRSLNMNIDTLPHTGKTVYNDSVAKIPIAAISTQDAEFISQQLQKKVPLKFKLYINTESVDKITTYNLIADIKGTEKPDEYILLGAHIDSWYNTCGAHDDGSGCVQMVDVIRILKGINYKNKHSIRLVLFMDEELFQSGADHYAVYSENKKLKYLAALESDAGGFAPRGIAVDASDSVVNKLKTYISLLEPYGLYDIHKGSTDVDIERLKRFNVPLIGTKPNSQRYFDFHHNSSDTFDKVNFRELQFGTSTIAGLVYLIDTYGIK